MLSPNTLNSHPVARDKGPKSSRSYTCSLRSSTVLDMTKIYFLPSDLDFDLDMSRDLDLDFDLACQGHYGSGPAFSSYCC